MSGGDPARAWQAGGLGQGLHGQAGQLGQEQEQAATLGEEAAWGQGEGPHVGDGFDRRPGVLGPFLIQATGQRGEALRPEDLAHSGGA